MVARAPPEEAGAIALLSWDFDDEEPGAVTFIVGEDDLATVRVP